MNKSELIKEYYENRFHSQFEQWVKKTHAHEHPGEGVYIPNGDLDEKYLSHIPVEDRVCFFYSLGWTVLIDQVMYTYFKKDYPKFQSLTLYPKIEIGITSINVNPSYIFKKVVTGDRATLVSFFLSDLKEFFDENIFEEANWNTVARAMISDKDVEDVVKEEIFKRELNIT